MLLSISSLGLHVWVYSQSSLMRLMACCAFWIPLASVPSPAHCTGRCFIRAGPSPKKESSPKKKQREVPQKRTGAPPFADGGTPTPDKRLGGCRRRPRNSMGCGRRGVGWLRVRRQRTQEGRLHGVRGRSRCWREDSGRGKWRRLSPACILSTVPVVTLYLRAVHQPVCQPPACLSII